MVKTKFFKAFILGRYPFCQWCERPLDLKSGTIDHILATVNGGKTHPNNLCLSCYACNKEKSNHDWGTPRFGPTNWGAAFDEYLIEVHKTTRVFEDVVALSDFYWTWKLETALFDVPKIHGIKIQQHQILKNNHIIQCDNPFYRLEISEDSFVLYDLASPGSIAVNNWDAEHLYHVLRIYESGCILAKQKHFSITKEKKGLGIHD